MSFETQFSKPQPKKNEESSDITRREKISRTTGRGLEFYQQFLGIDPTDFEKKVILNLGAGSSDVRSQLESRGITPKLLVSLDLAYKNIGDSKGLLSMISGKALDRKDVPQNGVAGDMKQLPFQNDSFDKVMGLWSVGWLEEKDRPQAVSEAYRVCKAGGEVKLHPVRYTEATEAVFQKYPFIEVSKPRYDFKKLFTSGTATESVVAKMKQYFSNFDAIIIERFQLLNNEPFGRSVGNMTIRKEEGISEADVCNAVEDLQQHGLRM